MKFNKAIVTGGAGFIGSAIASGLINSGKEVVVYDNLSVGKKENIPENCKFIKGDLKNKKLLKHAMKDCDVLLHNAAFVSIRGSFLKLRKEINSNCLGTLNAFESALNSGIKKIVFASSMAVYGHPKYLPVNEKHPLTANSPYGLSKIRGEQYCRIFEEEYGIKTVSLRYFNTYGVKQTPSQYVGVTTIFITNVLNGKPMIVFGDGSQTRDFVWVEDIAQANLLATESDISNEVFNVGSGQRISVNEIANMIKNAIGGQINYGKKPYGEIEHIAADISKIKSLLGYKPKGKFKEILPSIINWYK